MNISSIEDVISGLLEKYKKCGFEPSQDFGKKSLGAINNLNAFPDSIIDQINEFIKKNHEPLIEPTEWLNVVDQFIVKKSGDHLNLAIVELLTPLYSFEVLLSLECFSESMIRRFELGVYTRLSIPRNIPEFKRFYQAILKVSEPSGFIKAILPKISSQPFLAQMMFALLIIRQTEKKSEEWCYQLDLLKNCPEYLLDYPDISINKGSYRPAFWMAHFVTHEDFREILEVRSTDSYRKCLNDVRSHEEKMSKSNQHLLVDEPFKAEDFLDLVDKSQLELAKLLINFEELLKIHHPDIYKCLQPGLKLEQIEKFNQVIAPLKMPKDLETLYLWHNGVNDDGFLFGFPEFLPLNYALQQYKDSIEVCGEYLWCKAWFVLAYESRVYRLIPLSERTVNQSIVISHDIEGGDLEVHHESIAAMIKSYVDAYKSGICELDEVDEYRELDEEEFEKIRLKYSPQGYSFNKGSGLSYKMYEGVETWPEEWQRYTIGNKD